jgi:hypothetical protein
MAQFSIRGYKPPRLEERLGDQIKLIILNEDQATVFQTLTDEKLAHASAVELAVLCSGGLVGMISRKDIHYLRTFEKLRRASH